MLARQKKIHNTWRRWKPGIGYGNLKKGRIIFLIVGGLLLSSLAVAAPTIQRITLGTFAPYYSPNLVHIKTGMPISWENPTADVHTITHDGCQAGERCAFDSGPLGPNGTFTVRHLPPGQYPYHCSFHPIMRGTLVVTEPDTTSSET